MLIQYINSNIFVGLLLLMTGQLFAQDALLSEEERMEDLAVFSRALIEVHPGLDIYQEEHELEALIEQLTAQKGQTNLSDFYRQLLGVVATIKDGHTDLFPGKRYMEAYPYFQQLLPVKVDIIGDDVYIIDLHGDKSALPLYSRILSVNGYSTKEILDILYAHTPSDGGNVGFKECYNEKIFSRQLAQLLSYKSTYTLEYLAPSETESKTVDLPAVSEDQLYSQVPTEEIPLTFEVYPEQNYAKLTVNTFQYRWVQRAGIDFHDFLEESFATIRKESVEHFILDLRNNYGGDNILAVTLYSYLTQGHFQAMSPSLTRLGDKVSVSEYSNYPTGEFRFLRSHRVEDMGDGWYKLSEGIDSQASYDSDFIYRAGRKKPQQITRNKFSGAVYCLTSGITFSAGANLASLLSREKQATFVGNETGGANGLFCGGGFYNVTLPHSGFKLQIPFMRRSVAHVEQQEGIGVVPDYIVEQHIDAVMSDRDPVIEEVLRLIKQANLSEDR